MPLYRALRAGHVDMITRLIEAKADPNKKCFSMWNAQEGGETYTGMETLPYDETKTEAVKEVLDKYVSEK